ncbi:MAG: 3-oxoacyl-[acyl-carrier-protein] reductase [Betaproteobacteria bacterium]|jgi:3-oxoacyl-[acyl-carrier protein] reductase|nr:3-oxoacyl-[acyl-carrier-protein] reductase [Candidatus Binatia bacterium]
MTLAGQVAVVTGASRGIGRAIALSLAKAGAYVVLNYRGNQTAADTSLAAIVEQGGRGELSRFDVANESEIEQAVKKIVDGHNKIDILVNNAGVTADNLLMRISAVDWDQVIGTNLKGTILCTKVVSRHMIRQRFGRILNMSSVAGQTGNAGQSLYAASKAGIIGFTKTIARELASRNVTANVIAPGFIETDMTAKLSEQQREKSVQLIPLGRFGTCQEVADMVVFLAGEKAGYITGQVFSINGGLYM